MRRMRALSVNCRRLSWQARSPKRLWNQASPRHWEETMYGTNAELPPIFFPRFMFQPAQCLASASVHRSWDPESGQGKKMPSLTRDGQVMAIQHATKSVQIARVEQCSDCGALAACATTYINISYSGRKCKMSRASSYVWRQDLDGSMILHCLYQKCVGAVRAFGNFGGLLRGTRHHLIPETVATVF